MKRIFPYLVVSLLSLSLGFAYRFHLPQIKLWILQSLQIYSYENLPLTIKAEKLDLELLPPRLSLQNISFYRAKSQPQLPLRSLKISTIALQASLKDFLLGRARLARVKVSDIQAAMVIDKTSDSSAASPATNPLPPLSKKMVEQWFDKIPVDELEIENLSLYGRHEALGLSQRLLQARIRLQRVASLWQLDVDIPELSIKETQIEKSLLQLRAEQRVLVSPDKIKLERFRLFQDDSYIDITANVKNWFLWQQAQYEISLKSSLRLQKITQLIKRFLPDSKWPSLRGKLESDINLSSQDLQHLRGRIWGSGLGIDQYEIGQLQSQWDVKPERIEIRNLEIERLGNRVGGKEILLQKIQDRWQLTAALSIPHLEIQQLLADLGLGRLPLEILVKDSELNCSGPLAPSFLLECSGALQVARLRVSSGADKADIVRVNQLRLEGGVKIDAKGVYPEGRIQIGQSQGRASGQVLYREGFDFKFASESLHFADIEDLAGLGLQGVASLKGETQGDSREATFAIDLDAKSFEIFKFQLGNVKTQLRYAKSKLRVEKIRSRSGQSTLTGSTQLDFSKNRLQGSIEAKSLQISDLEQILTKQVRLPLKIQAAGPLSLQFSGPFDVRAMDYQILYQSPFLEIQGENFEKLYLALRAQKGNLQSQRFDFKKAGAEPLIQGKLALNPLDELQLSFFIDRLPLRSLQWNQRFAGSMDGQLSGDFVLQGKIPQFNYETKAELKNFSIHQKRLGNSQIEHSYDGKHFRSSATLLNEAVELSWRQPVQSDQGDYRLQVKARDFDFMPLFSLLGINTLQAGFSSKLSADVELNANQGGFWRSSGQVSLQKIEIERGNKSLRNQEPWSMSATNGVFSAKKLLLTGQDNRLEIQLSPSGQQNINSLVRGSLDLALISFAIPFVDDLRGSLSFDTKITGSTQQLDYSGTAFLKEGFFRIPNFVHPFENLKADLLLKKDQIAIQQLEAELADGKLLGSGKLALQNLTKIPLEFSANLSNARLGFIEGLTLVTDADLKLSGEWFPFLLEANAVVKSGMISPKAKSSAKVVRPSRYLPEVILKKSFDPLQVKVKAQLLDRLQIKVPQLDSYVRGQLQIQGPLGALSYNGDLSLIPNGKIFFRDTAFNLTTGNIRFRNQTELNPDFFISGVTMITEKASDINYDVEIQLQGNLQNFSTRLESQPALNESDLISLLALGLTSNQLEAQAFDTQSDRPIMEIGAAVITNTPLGKEIEDRTGFSFRLSTDIDETATTQYRVVVSKQVSPKLGASASILGNNTRKDVRVEYKLNKELSVIGSWESITLNEDANSSVNENQESDIFGIDLRYKVEFR